MSLNHIASYWVYYVLNNFYRVGRCLFFFFSPILSHMGPQMVRRTLQIKNDQIYGWFKFQVYSFISFCLQIIYSQFYYLCDNPNNMELAQYVRMCVSKCLVKKKFEHHYTHRFTSFNHILKIWIRIIARSKSRTKISRGIHKQTYAFWCC